MSEQFSHDPNMHPYLKLGENVREAAQEMADAMERSYVDATVAGIETAHGLHTAKIQEKREELNNLAASSTDMQAVNVDITRIERLLQNPILRTAEKEKLRYELNELYWQREVKQDENDTYVNDFRDLLNAEAYSKALEAFDPNNINVVEPAASLIPEVKKADTKAADTASKQKDIDDARSAVDSALNQKADTEPKQGKTQETKPNGNHTPTDTKEPKPVDSKADQKTDKTKVDEPKLDEPKPDIEPKVKEPKTPEKTLSPESILAEIKVGMAEKALKGEDRIINDSKSRTFGVIDGMGGHGSGDFAAKIIQESIQEFFAKYKDQVDEFTGRDLMKAAFSDAMDAMQAAIERGEGNKDMGAVASVVHMFEGTDGKPYALVGHVGDTRIYAKGANGFIERFTRDEGQFNVVDNALSASSSTHPSTELNQFKVVPLFPRDRLMICSDGITGDTDYESLTLQEIAEALSIDDVQASADKFIEISRKDDDKSVLVIQLGNEARPKLDQDKPKPDKPKNDTDQNQKSDAKDKTDKNPKSDADDKIYKVGEIDTKKPIETQDIKGFLESVQNYKQNRNTRKMISYLKDFLAKENQDPKNLTKSMEADIREWREMDDYSKMKAAGNTPTQIYAKLEKDKFPFKFKDTLADWREDYKSTDREVPREMRKLFKKYDKLSDRKADDKQLKNVTQKLQPYVKEWHEWKVLNELYRINPELKPTTPAGKEPRGDDEKRFAAIRTQASRIGTPAAAKARETWQSMRARIEDLLDNTDENGDLKPKRSQRLRDTANNVKNKLPRRQK